MTDFDIGIRIILAIIAMAIGLIIAHKIEED